MSVIESRATLHTLIPISVSRQFEVVPLSIDDQTLTIATPNELAPSNLQDLTFLVGKRIRPKRISREEFEKLQKEIYQPVSIDDPPREFVHAERPPLQRSGPAGKESPIDTSVVAFVDRTIADAISQGVSDIHVEPNEEDCRVRYRIDGVLHEIQRIPIARARAILSRLKVMAQLDISEKRRPQDGRIRCKHSDRSVDIRVSTLPMSAGEKIVLRILDRSQVHLDLSTLGLDERDLEAVRRTIRLPYGLILVTGPTGSGKTTTLYAALQAINNPGINITTIEDPIEYDLDGVNQMHVRPDIGVTFATALRSILRQDPDVIMIGEIRDSETASIAIRAALTGHLVFSTLHTNDAPSAVTRLVDMGIEPFLVSSSLRMIIAQRLVRQICPKCAVPHVPDSDEKEMLRSIGLATTQTYSRGMGCSACRNYGYRGRTGVFEILRISEELAESIAHGVTASQLRKQAQTGGMKTLQEAALSKAASAITTLDEVFRQTAL